MVYNKTWNEKSVSLFSVCEKSTVIDKTDVVLKITNVIGLYFYTI